MLNRLIVGVAISDNDIIVMVRMILDSVREMKFEQDTTTPDIVPSRIQGL